MRPARSERNEPQCFQNGLSDTFLQGGSTHGVDNTPRCALKNGRVRGRPGGTVAPRGPSVPKTLRETH